jgi:YVTN family beta-propeller protein
MKLVATIAVGQRPWGIALSPDGATLFAADGPANDVAVIDTKARRVIGRIPAGAGPWGIAVVRAGANAPPIAAR